MVHYQVLVGGSREPDAVGMTAACTSRRAPATSRGGREPPRCARARVVSWCGRASGGRLGRGGAAAASGGRARGRHQRAAGGCHRRGRRRTSWVAW